MRKRRRREEREREKGGRSKMRGGGEGEGGSELVSLPLANTPIFSLLWLAHPVIPEAVGGVSIIG